MNRTKEDWIKEIRSNYITYTALINGKKEYVSYFYKYASEEYKNDRELNILNFIYGGSELEIPSHMVNLEFIREVLIQKKISKIFSLNYEWKNNSYEKKALKEILSLFEDNHVKINWSFEPGFWSDIEYTKDIENYYYDDINIQIIKELKNSKDKNAIDFIFKMVDINPYYLKYINNKQKNSLPQRVIFDYVSSYGIKELTKQQKNTYEIIKKAFHHHKITYHDIDLKWKTKEILVDLLSSKSIWSSSLNGEEIMSVTYLSSDLLNDKEIIKNCLNNGENLLKLKLMRSDYFYNYDFKKLALKTYPSYEIIEDCLDNKEMVLEFFKNINNKENGCIYYNKSLTNQLNKIEKSLFKDKEIMTRYLSVSGLNVQYIDDFIKELLVDYEVEDLVDFININKDIYGLLSEDKKMDMRLILAYYKKSNGESYLLPSSITKKFDLNPYGDDTSKKMIEVLNEMEKLILKENLDRKLIIKKSIPKLKI